MPRPKTDYIRYVCNFTIKQYEALKDKSDEEGIPIAHQVRTAINEYIKNLVLEYLPFSINQSNLSIAFSQV